MSSRIEQAKYLLEGRTPLREDCGQVCARACCAGGGGYGMLLFPGEEDWMRQRHAPDTFARTENGGTLFVCAGRCERADRPLGCRLFPLFPHLNGETGRIRAVYDPRAWRVCPLVREHRRVRLDRDFVRTVRTVGRLLAEDEGCRRFLAEQSAEIDDINRFLRLGDERSPVCRKAVEKPPR